MVSVARTAAPTGGQSGPSHGVRTVACPTAASETADTVDRRPMWGGADINTPKRLQSLTAHLVGMTKVLRADWSLRESGQESMSPRARSHALSALPAC